MLRVLLLLALAAPALAVDIWTPVIPAAAGDGVCRATAATNATPIHVTVVNIAKCGVVNDSTIWTGQFHGNTAANVHPANNTDVDGLIYVAKNVSGNSFDLYKADGTTAVAGNGAWTYGGSIARAQLRTLNSLPTPFLDGASGPLTALLSDTTSAGYAYASRPEYIALMSRVAGYSAMTDTHQDIKGTMLADLALAWYAEGKPGSSTIKTKLVNGLMNSLPVPSTACVTSTTIECHPTFGSSYSDYSIELYSRDFSLALELGLDALSSPQKDTLRNYYLGDYAWPTGHNYPGTSMTFPTFDSVSGTISVAYNSTAVTGFGTNFTSGDIGKMITINAGSVYAYYMPICAVADTTHLTLCHTPESAGVIAGSSGDSYAISTPWADNGTDMGWLGFSKMNNYTFMCGGYQPYVPGCSGYASGAGGGGPTDPHHNHQMGRLALQMRTFLTWAAEGGDPVRANWIATEAMFNFVHFIRPGLLNMGGMGGNHELYHLQRIIPAVATGMGVLQRAFTDEPDYTGGGADGDAWWDELIKSAMMDRLKPSTNAAFEYQAVASSNGTGVWATALSGFTASFFRPLAASAAAFKNYLTVDLTGTGAYANTEYLTDRPDITATRGNTSLNTRADISTGCPAIYDTDWSWCGTDRRFFFASKSGTTAAGAWDHTGANILYPMWSTRYRDHGGQIHEVGPKVVINKEMMIEGDNGWGLFASLGKGNIFIVGAESALGTTYGHGSGAPNVNDFKGISTPLFSYGTTRLSAEGVDISNHYNPAVQVVNTSNREALHFKATGLGFLVQRDDFATPGSVTAQTYTHYHLATCGGSPSGVTSPCTMTLSRSGQTLEFIKSTTARVHSWFSGTVDTANSSDTDGSYTGGGGNTFRVTNAVTGTSGSVYAIHQLNTSSGSAPTVSGVGVQDSFWVAEVTGSGSAGCIVPVLSPVAEITRTTASITTTHPGTCQYGFTGFAAGTYDVSRNGSPVCAGVVVVDGEHVIDCDSGSGAITVAIAGGSPVIDQTTLPDGTVGAAYSQTLTATGGAGSNTWDISSGTLCTGLSLSSGGAITGTPTVAQTCSFTARVTDASMNTGTQALSITVNVTGAGQRIRGGKVITGGKTI